VRWSVVTSAETAVTTPFSSGVVRWLKADSRSSVFWPICSLSMSCGSTLASTCRSSACGHDHHDGVAGGDHAADGVHRRLQHHAVLRRADVDPAQLILGGNFALDELADLVVGLAQVLGDPR
jgi:hypothetical protein